MTWGYSTFLMLPINYPQKINVVLQSEGTMTNLERPGHGCLSFHSVPPKRYWRNQMSPLRSLTLWHNECFHHYCMEWTPSLHSCQMFLKKVNLLKYSREDYLIQRLFKSQSLRSCHHFQLCREQIKENIKLILEKIIQLLIIDHELVEYLLVVKHSSALFSNANVLLMY